MHYKQRFVYILFLAIFLLSACRHTDTYDGNVRPTEIRESQTTNEVALTNLNLGIAYLKEADYNKALEKLKKALAADSGYSPTYNVMGLLYQELGDNKKAEENFKRALSINSVDSSTLNNYGNFLCKFNRVDEAEKAFLKAAENPLYDSPEIAFTNAGQCLYQNKKVETAKKYFRQALQLNPRIPQALIKMSEMSYDDKNYLSARAYLQRYQEGTPHNAKTLLLGIKIENKLGDKDASASYELLLKNSFPDSDEVASLESIKTSEIKKIKKVVAKTSLQQENENKEKPASKELIVKETTTDVSKNYQAIELFINNWVNAWSAQDVDNYLASYAKEFIPAKGLSRNRWVKQRTERLLVPSFIKVSLTNLEINMRGENYAKVSFTQKYHSDTYRDRTKKELLLERIAGEWLILQEQFEVNEKTILRREKPASKELIVKETTTDVSKNYQAIELFINNWVNAWSAQDVDNYLASYAKEFIPAKGLSRNRWVKQRTERLLVPSFIKVSLTNLEINMRGENYAKVSFTQKYHSDTYRDRTKKELLLERIAGEWLIIKEK